MGGLRLALAGPTFAKVAVVMVCRYPFVSMESSRSIRVGLIDKRVPWIS